MVCFSLVISIAELLSAAVVGVTSEALAVVPKRWIEQPYQGHPDDPDESFTEPGIERGPALAWPVLREGFLSALQLYWFRGASRMSIVLQVKP
jgi:hypothetical protein